MPFDIVYKDTPTWRKATQEAKLAIATTMLIDKMPIEQVAKFTKLSIDEVKAIENNLLI